MWGFMVNKIFDFPKKSSGFTKCPIPECTRENLYKDHSKYKGIAFKKSTYFSGPTTKGKGTF